MVPRPRFQSSKRLINYRRPRRTEGITDPHLAHSRARPVCPHMALYSRDRTLRDIIFRVPSSLLFYRCSEAPLRKFSTVGGLGDASGWRRCMSRYQQRDRTLSVRRAKPLKWNVRRNLDAGYRLFLFRMAPACAVSRCEFTVDCQRSHAPIERDPRSLPLRSRFRGRLRLFLSWSGSVLPPAAQAANDRRCSCVRKLRRHHVANQPVSSRYCPHWPALSAPTTEND